MSYIMLCQHQNTSPRLIAWAQMCRGEHTQGFRMAVCCSTCGVEVKHGRVHISATEAIFSAIDFAKEKTE